MINPQTVDEFMMQSARITEPSYVVHFDGCSKGNPGAAGAGAVLYQDGKEIQVATKYVGDNCTNNEAEWTGLLLGLAMCADRGIKNVTVRGDSQLVIKQMQGTYEVRHPMMRQLHGMAQRIIAGMGGCVRFEHVLRAANSRADELSNVALRKKD
jgi:ribonuclease HI